MTKEEQLERLGTVLNGIESHVIMKTPESEEEAEELHKFLNWQSMVRSVCFAIEEEI